ncbi:MAG TPA: hypothetical protein VGB38_02555, partial [bacterium]
KSPSGDPLIDLVSQPKKIFQPESEPLLWNYPNPFGGPGKEETQIVYCLTTDQAVSFKLYTLTGELVWTFSLAPSDPRARAGTHAITWNGRNGLGSKVINGVYLLFMKTADGKVEKTKIALVK